MSLNDPSVGLRMWPAVSSALLLVAACGDPIAKPQPDAPKQKGTESGIAAARDQPASRVEKLWNDFPPMYGVVLDFDGEFTTESPINLRSPTQIEFIPAVVGTCDGCTMEVAALDGAEEIPLASLPVARLPSADEPVAESPARYDFLQLRAEVDLSGLVGRTVRVRWRLKSVSADVEPPRARLLDYKLRLKQDYSQLPPILFICSDAHRYDHAFGSLGEKLMPRLNELRGQSVLYSRATSTASWTLPSITSVFTGLYPRFHRTGERVRETTKAEMESVAFETGQFSMGRGAVYYVFNAYPDRPVSLGEALGERGYTTALVVSNMFYVVSGLFADGHDWTVEAKVATGGVVNAAATGLIERLPKNHPLFMLVHYLDVHEFIEARFKVEHPGQDPYFADPQLLRGYYADAVRDADQYLNELLQVWDREIGLDRSMVVFYADHGEHLFDPGRPPLDEKYRTQPDARAQLASALLDHGNSMDETLLHVPLLVKYPVSTKGAPAPGDEVTHPVSLVDLYPTVLGMIGRRIPDEPWRGTSLLSADSGKGGVERTLYHDYQLYGPERAAVRRGDRKLVLEEAGNRLVDLTIDSGESGEPGQEVSDPAVQTALEQAAAIYRETSDEATEGLRSSVRMDQQQTLDDLEALGYLK